MIVRMPDDRSPSTNPALLRAAAVAVLAIIAIRMARRELNDPVDDTGAAVRLSAERGPIGASADAHVVPQVDEPEWIRDLASWTPRPPRTTVGRLVAVLWALPSTLLGLVVGLLTGVAPQLRDGVLLFAGARGLPGLLLRRTGFAATTLGHVVIARGTPSEKLMAHELLHTRQAERLGPLMGPVYWGLLARYGYARHPMERAARLAGRDAATRAASSS